MSTSHLRTRLDSGNAERIGGVGASLLVLLAPLLTGALMRVFW